MKKQLLMMACLTVAALLFAACGGPDKSAFNHAAPDIKQVWNQAIAADRANNYVAANTNYASLLIRQISAEQQVAVHTALGALNQRMQNAAVKGDAIAQKAIEDLKNLRGPSRPGRPGQP